MNTPNNHKTITSHEFLGVPQGSILVHFSFDIYVNDKQQNYVLLQVNDFVYYQPRSFYSYLIQERY